MDNTRKSALSADKRALLAKRIRGELAKETYAGIPKRTTNGSVPLSFAQERMWFLEQFFPGVAVYNIPTMLRIEGPLDLGLLEKSVNELLRRHEVLRTVFATVDGEPCQIIAEDVQAELGMQDLTHLPPLEQQAETDRLAREEAERLFDLTKGPLVRTTVVRLSETEHVVLLTFHHIVADGWSLALTIGEIGEIYEAFWKGESSPLPELPVQYADYAVWQREQMQGVLAKQIEYWKQQLGTPADPLELPLDKPRPAQSTFQGSVCALPLSDELTKGIRALCEREGVTLFMMLLAALQVFLHRYTGQEDIRVGTPVAGRNRGEIEGLIGLFVNTLTMRAELGGNPVFRDVLQAVRKTSLDAFAHQDLPFEKLVEELHVERNLTQSPLFQVMFAVRGIAAASMERGGLNWVPLERDPETAMFDLTVVFVEMEDSLRLEFEYSTDLFEAASIQRMMQHFLILLEGMVKNPLGHIGELPLLDAKERELLLTTWNDTATDYPRDLAVHAVFEAQAAQTPDAVALEFEDIRLTYRELNQQANRLARELLAQGAAGQFVGVYMERSPELIVAFLAVLKAGAAYVPLDVNYPPERLAFMLEDAQAAVLLTQPHLTDRDALKAQSVEVLAVDLALLARSAVDAGDLSEGVTADFMACMMYTSGSTGRPKGVCIPHRAMVRLVKGMTYCDLNERDVLLQYAATAFDAAIYEIWGALLNGAKLVVFPPHQASLDELGRFVQERGVTTLFLTSGLFNQMVDTNLHRLQGLRQLLTGGDVMSAAHAKKALESLSCRLINVYGPTENTTYSAVHTVQLTDDFTHGVSIGKPISNSTVYLLNEEMQPVPIGVPGEVYAGGDGVALGYWNLPELTMERFVEDPFAGKPDAYLYRTGDLARWRADGTLAFIGRKDNQIKLRGFRIELGEIEAVLQAHAGVLDAVVTVREVVPGDKRLAAYVVLAEKDLSKQELHAYVSERLPEHMLPAAYVLLDVLPLTPNGKVDRRALPAPDEFGLGAETEYVAPRNALEKQLAAIFAELLGVEQVGVQDSFFQIGGHSLLATRLVAWIRDELGAELPMRNLFAGMDTVAALAEFLEQAESGELTGTRAVIPKRAEGSSKAALSFAQQRLWLIDQLDPGSPLYNVPATLRLSGELNVRALEQSCNEMVRRHESLRTVFEVVDGEPIQVVQKDAFLPLTMVDIQGADDPEREIVSRVSREVNASFDLEKGPLVRLLLIQAGPDDHVLVLTMHHIISDGWSMGVFTQEIAALYEAFCQDLPSPLTDLSIQYADYAVWQRERLQGDVLTEQLSYWKQKLGGELHVLQLPTDRPRPTVQTHRGSSVAFHLPQGLADNLQAVGQQEGSTLYMTLLAAFKILLSRYSGQHDILVGSPIAGRQHRQLEGLIGFFVNTLVMRTDLSGELTFTELLHKVKETTLEAYAHQEVPFEMLVAQLQLERNMSYSPLFQVMFAMQNLPAGSLEAEGLTFRPLEMQAEQAKFDLTLVVAEGEDGLYGSLEYNADLFDEQTAERIAGNYQQLLRALVEQPTAKIEQLPLLTEEERSVLLHDWSGTQRDDADDSCLHTLFEAQAARTPNEPALIFGEHALTYHELNGKANQLARTLQKAGLGREGLVGVAMERSLEMIIAILAVQKAGGAYVPLDLSAPADRIAYMLSDSQAEILLTKQQHLSTLPEHQARVIAVDLEQEFIAQEDVSNLQVDVKPDNLVYVIYTSGSTGRPKGVLLEHRSVCNTIRYSAERLQTGTGRRMLQFASLSFDASVYDIFIALTSGAALVLAEKEQLLPGAGLAELIRGAEVTDIVMTPSVLTLLPEENLPTLRTVVSGAEACPAELVARWSGAGRTFFNVYGPTEASIIATMAVNPDTSRTPDIGRPLPNNEVYILDRHLQPVPVGVPGELYLGGAGVARGYLNRPDLTAAAFIPHPFSAKAGARLYKTGDVARWNQDGTLDCLGRIDNQVKIRGFRIELGEVEAVLQQHPAVQQSAALVREDVPGLKRLVAYALLEPTADVTAGDLRLLLQEKLPEYMVPSAIVLLEQFPLNTSGKTDYRALPAPEGLLEETAEYAAPRNEAEEKVARLFAELLGAEQVGAHDSFFDRGGHSLLGAQLVSRIRNVFDMELPLRALFEHPTVAGLAKLLSGTDVSGVQLPPLRKAERGATSPLSYAQQRLWFLDQLQPGSNAYNMPAALKLHGELNIDAVQHSFNEIVCRHESLRTTIQMVEGEPMQVIAPYIALDVQMIDLTATEDRETELQRLAVEHATGSFDLQQGPLLRAAVVKMSAEEHALLVNMHHIISDGWSMSVLIQEFAALYEAFSQDQPSPLAELPVQFADYAVWERGWMQGETLDEQLAYWKTKLGGDLPVLELPTDRTPEDNHGQSARQEVLLSEAATQKLKQLSRAEGVTPFMTLLAAFKTLLSRLTGQEDIIVGTPVANRGTVETEGLIGLLLNTLALRTDLSGTPTFRELLGRVKEMTLEAFARQEVPFEKIVEEIQPERSLNRSPVFDVMINFINTPSTDLTLQGLTLSSLTAGEEPASKYLMTLYISEQGEQMHLSLVYQRALFSSERMQAFTEQLESLLEQVTADTDSALNTYTLLTDAARDQLPDPTVPLDEPHHPFIRDLFTKWAGDTPHHPALTQGGREVSYATLHERAEQLARVLVANGVQKGDTVAVAGTRTVGFITAMLGVLFSGGVLVQIDYHLPYHRQQVMVEQSNAQHLLFVSEEAMTSDWQALFPSFDIVQIDSATGIAVEKSAPATTVLPELSADDPAYIFFTSGSTGLPKGVLGTHKGLNHFLAWQRSTFDIGPTDRVAQLIHLSFDPVLRDVFLPLTSGATLCLPDVTDDLGGDVILPWLEREGITLLHTVPSVAQAWAADHSNGVTLKNLRHLFLAGEPLTDMLVNRLRTAFPELGDIINLYGPTETTLAKCFYIVPEAPTAGIQPAGDTLPETQALVLNEAGQLCGIGEQGEIVLRTPFRTLGYVNAPEENKKFAPNPFRPHDTADKLYFTGDKGRYRPDGRLEILGRLDDQVKVRGVRIQLHEVSSTLLRHEAVNACAVIDWKDDNGQPELAAYTVLKEGQHATAADLRAHLERHLLAAMVPSAFLFLDALPRLANGKVNRKALPKPERERGTDTAYEAPRNAVEEKLALAFADVLKLERVGIHDNFFALGGHSLLATQLVARVRQGLQVELPLRYLFEHPTVARLAEGIAAQQDASTRDAAIRPTARDEQTAVPLSFAQQRLWFLDQLDPGSNAYNMPYALHLHGGLDIDALHRSFQEIVRRHETLRTTFGIVDEQAVQVIAPALELDVPLQDLTGTKDSAAELQRLLMEDALRPFDLQQGPLLRVSLVRLAADEHALLVNLHHIIGDAWSVGVLIQEFVALYGAFSQGQPSPLTELPVQFADYAIWQRGQLQGETLSRQLSYWTTKLGGDLPVLELPTDRTSAEVNGQSANCTLLLTEELTQAVKNFSLQEGATPFMTLLAVFQTLLARLTGQEDIIVGTPIAGRGRVETEGLIGLLLNTLALRTDLSGAPTFRELLRRVRQTTFEAYEHQDVPFEKIVEEIQPERSLHRNPVFDVMINYVNTPSTQAELPGLTITDLEADQEPASKFQMTLYIAEQGEQLNLSLVYQAALFSAERMSAFMEQFHSLLEQAVQDAELAIGRCSLLTANTEQILPDPSAPLAEPQYPFIRDLFANWATHAPEQTAVTQSGQKWSYAELHERAEKLALVLVANGVQPGDAVAVAGTRNFGFVTAMLGVLFSGGVLVPIDYHLPLHRQQVMVEQSKARHLLFVSEEEMTSDWQALFTSFDIVRIDPSTGAAMEKSAPATIVLPELSADDPAYLFFTSGSTGVPKGVLGTHKGLNHFLDWQRSTFDIGPSDRVAQLIHLSFDAVLRDVFLPLTSGATLCLPAVTDDLGGDVILPWLEREGITLLHTVPSVAQAWATDRPHGITLRSLKHLFLAGEPLTDVLVNRLRGAFPAMGDIINLYGPTETTMVKCFHIVPQTPTIGIQPAGLPFPDTQALVLNVAGQLCGIGEQGEIVLRTPFRTLGYVNAPEENMKFAPNPFRPYDIADKVYFTGDKGRYRPDGSLEILGRIDDQVKVRGVRIQLHEVSSTLLRHQAVDACAVIDWKDDHGQTELAAYVVVKPGQHASAADLRAHLERHLLAAMVPSAYLFLDALPRLANGKVNRKALPKPERERGAEVTYVAPRNAVEEKLAGMFAEVLKLERVGMHDNFFALGGHSLIATQLVSRVRRGFEVEMPLRTLFEAPTVEALAERLADLRPGAAEEFGSDAAETGPTPLSFAQQRLWFIDQLEPASSAYNISTLMRLNGPLDLQVLEQCLAELVKRHESLRTVFPSQDGEPVQEVLSDLVLPLMVTDLQGRADAEATALQQAHAQAQRPFDLTTGPLAGLYVYQMSGEEHLLLLLMHHIISDGWSMGVFMRELVTLYDAFQNGISSPLAPLPVQYTRYSRWQRSRFQGEGMQGQLDYWKGQLGGELPVLELPTDRPRPAVAAAANGAKLNFDLPPQLTAAVRELSQREGATLYMTLLAAFQTLLARYTGQQDILIGSPIAGRNRQELESLIGFFVNTLVLRTDLTGDPGFTELLQRVKRTTLDAYANQDVPFEMLVAELQPDREMGRTPLFQALFVLQNTPNDRLEVPGLTLTGVPLAGSTAKFDLTLMMAETDAGLSASIEYNTDLWDAATIERMSGHFTTLLEGLTANPTQPIGTLPMLTAPEAQQLLDEWSMTVTDYPRETAVHRLLEQQAASTPDATAVIFEKAALSYGELNRQANRLAHRLQQLGVQRGSFVGISMERSIEMIVAMLAILKAGGAYVPFDRNHPQDRLRDLFADTGVGVLLTQSHLADQLPEHGAAVILVDTDTTLAQESDDNLPTPVTADDVAYIMYTSGSTGKPKGVLVPHRGIVRLVRDTHYAEFTRDDVFLQFAPTAFDAATLEIWGALLNGAKLVIFPPHQASFAELGAAVQEHGVTILWLTAGLFHGMVEHQPEGLRGLRYLLAGGDVLSVPHVHKALQHIDGCLINGYGPSENTTFTTCHTVTDPSRLGHTVPIGRPIANTSVYVLDAQGQPVPIGVPGELYTGGDGLALGYLNQPELTDEKFIPNPFGAGKLYRTGDAVRWMQNGTLEFIGRIDSQVKIRGFRVEIGEIEAALTLHPSVRDAAVVVHETAGDKRLAAYLTAEQGEALTATELAGFLKQTLPDYMIPAAFEVLDALPLNPNGKVDRKALASHTVTFEREAAYTAPQDRYELELVQIWSDVLGHSAIGVTDNFFTVGGHSLLAVRLVAQIEKRFGQKLPLSILFREGTIRSLAARLRQGGQELPSTPLVTIQPGLPGGAERPLFLVHAVGGSVFAYLDLARELGVEQPVYGLQARGLDEDRDPLTTIEEMAGAYITAIRTVQQSGPYRLGGWSLGGTVAYEMARQLRAMGEEVELLALIDSRAPLPAYQREMTDRDLLLAFARDLAGQHGLDLQKLSQADLSLTEDALSALLQAAREHQVLSSDIGLQDLKRLLGVFSSNYRALNRYLPERTAEPLLLIQAENAESSDYGWSELAEQLNVHRIGGDHFTLLQTPHVHDLSVRLKKALSTS